MKIDNDLASLLLEKANESFNSNEIPVSAAIFKSDTDEMIAIANNDRQSSKSVLGHAEINCILKAEKVINDWRLDGYYMIVTLEPCDMCSSVIKESRLDNVYYILSKISSSQANNSSNFFQVINHGEFESDFRKLLTSFFDNMR